MRSWIWSEVAMCIKVTGRRAVVELTPSWMDRVVVDRVLAQRPPGRALSYAERVEVARRLDSPEATPGETGWVVSKLLGCSHSTATELTEVARGAAVAA